MQRGTVEPVLFFNPITHPLGIIPQNNNNQPPQGMGCAGDLHVLDVGSVHNKQTVFLSRVVAGYAAMMNILLVMFWRLLKSA